ncbi:hypothetical protein LABALGNA3A7_13100 [Dellaglioa algida]|uniref:Uncharacterized protein n=1 Tax=Dellaglioa carnosa TaxID=2995136 RepID=A0ABT4JNM5_9LACO|nr:hypothetical protein [Dellaglioa carnosa]TWW12854.1 hypothetical protein LABALGNA3A7_13100 [Dellaglioa algida]MCZ2491957.1 hypothetical protein [Dellaglioa carnosa]MCZ2493033.1 hypothetical protein [Dellaglioa carnosa]MCZ2495010.1 hypothetical protein [Dellaglioa carnosa]MDK1731878.1 hypothetical protein [Dellaglioa carnosa]
MFEYIRHNWIKISLFMIWFGAIVMFSSYALSGFNSTLFDYTGVHEWGRTFYF